MKITRLLTLVAAAIVAGYSVTAAHAQNLLYDGNFQLAGTSQGIQLGSYKIFNASLVQSGNNPIVGWQTTAQDNQLEVWGSGMQGFVAPTGSSYFAELNAYYASTLYQVVQITESSPVSFSLDHRGRNGTDVMQLNVYDLGSSTTWSASNPGTLVYTQQMSDGNTTWGSYSNSDMFTATAGDYYAFTFVSVSSAGGDQTVGNLLGAVQFGINVVPEPSTYALLGLGAVAFVIASRRNRKAVVA